MSSVLVAPACAGDLLTVSAGVDSWSPSWYVDRESPAAVVLDELACVRASRGALLREPVLGHRVGWVRAHGLLYAEGHPTEDGLCAPDDLPAALDRLVAAMVDAGVPVPEGVCGPGRWPFEEFGPGYLPRPGFAGVRRLDSTVDLPMASEAEGLAVLAGVAAMTTMSPRGQAEVRFSKRGDGSVETVYLRGLSGLKILGRWYDKGLESGTAGRGRLVRAEDQRRYPRSSRRLVSELTSQYVRGKFRERFRPLWRASKGVKVAGPLVLVDRMADLVEAGEISVSKAQRLSGFVLLSRRGLRQPVSTARRYRAELRELGLVLSDGVLTEVEVDLHEVLERALDEPVWGVQG